MHEKVKEEWFYSEKALSEYFTDLSTLWMSRSVFLSGKGNYTSTSSFLKKQKAVTLLTSFAFLNQKSW